jgi:hypothetical protein
MLLPFFFFFFSFFLSSSSSSFFFFFQIKKKSLPDQQGKTFGSILIESQKRKPLGSVLVECKNKVSRINPRQEQGKTLRFSPCREQKESLSDQSSSGAREDSRISPCREPKRKSLGSVIAESKKKVSRISPR